MFNFAIIDDYWDDYIEAECIHAAYKELLEEDDEHSEMYYDFNDEDRPDWLY